VALTKVSPSLFATTNNITSVTVGGSANTISLTFDSNGVITGASNNAVSVANTAITGNIISSQIASVSGSVITANTIANSAIQTGAVENYMSAAGLGFGMRNRIINGAMVIDQRNAGASVTANNDVFGVDRFKFVASQSSKLTVQQNAGSVTPPTGFSNYLGYTSSSAYSVLSSDFFFITQNIEGFNTADLAWGTANAATVTLSFRVYSSLTGTFGGALRNSASNRSYPFSYTISSANTWTTISVTIAGDTSGTWIGATNGIGLQLALSLGMGSTYNGTANAWASANYASVTGATSVVGTNGATFYITGVQLEKGSTATSFDYRPFGTELALCQRYYQRNFNPTYAGIGTASSAVLIPRLPVVMRVAPTVSALTTANIDLFGVGSANASSTTFDNQSTTGFRAYYGGMSGSTFGQPGHLTNDAIQASAEL